VNPEKTGDRKLVLVQLYQDFDSCLENEKTQVIYT